MKTIVLYHGGCRDGFCAAWVVNKYFAVNSIVNNVFNDTTIEYIPGYYGQEPPDVKHSRVIIVDFSYDVNTMKKILQSAAHVIWIDHHKTAELVNELFKENAEKNEYSAESYYRNDKSGAGLTWQFFFPNKPAPWIVDYVEDRDLWAKKLDRTDYVNAFIATLEFNFDIWESMSAMPLQYAIDGGRVAQAKTDQYVREVCKNVYFVDVYKMGGVSEDEDCTFPNIPVVNIAQIDCSEVLHELCKRYPDSPFSLYWFKRADGMYQYGLRSIGDFDVSAVAKLFGGGGHKNAAGFQLDYLLEELK